ncbi:signal transduction histidine kinase/PAS domain-containing protein [Parabacteroides sp. PFB2-12]|uniref:sensor histidine kinase n=1 Tax=unclassified Parabacteroides TaxID=2649774 RepID=UPI002476550E|nr:MULTISPECIES: ATP-binding protein [unclassified Parabacteroides]MDH6342699.1 signal transduction histidine kinase/PAS domain-containing protein [Parabacteroides sp. PM6-13]MDH6389762.1 signal transduction histidine kinase/PAS domain-containing protein [Parabacteroides sp. PFB2-12]
MMEYRKKYNPISNKYFKEKEEKTAWEWHSHVFDLLFYSKEDSAITDALSELLTCFGVDRAYLGLIHTDGTQISFKYEATAEGVRGIIEFLDQRFLTHLHLTEKELPWLFSQLRAKEDIVMHNIERIPIDAINCRNMIKDNNVCSLLFVPTDSRGVINGFLGIESVNEHREWTPEEVEQLHIFAKCFSYIADQEILKEEANILAMQTTRNDLLLQMVVENIPVGIEIYDEKGYLIEINPAGLDILVTTREDVLGVNLFENPTISDEVKALIRNGEYAYFENKYDFGQISDSHYFQSSAQQKYKSLVGKNVPLKDANGDVFGYLQLVYDNTEEYIEHYEKMRLAVDTGKSFIWEYDVKADKVTIDYSLSDESLIWGEKSEERPKIGQSYKNHLQRIHPEDTKRVFDEGVLPLLQGQISEFSATYRQWVHNQYFWLTTNFHVYKYDSEGLPLHVMCYSTNVTEQREMELELLRTREVGKLKSAFIENMSHEIRTPLNAIVGLSCFLADASDSEQNRELTDCIRSNSDQLLRIVDKMLYYTQLEAGTAEFDFKTIEVKPFCKRIMEKYLPKMPAGVKLVFKELPHSVSLYTDPMMLKQVISQLVENSINFTREGSITLAYETVGNDTLRFTVADTGIGIADADMETLFYPFYKAEAFHKGIGLGLSICKWIIDAFGGEIRVESALGEGSIFQFDLPLRKK